MKYKAVLVHVESSIESDVRLHAAVDLARQFDATLIGVGGGEPLYIDNSIIAAYDDGSSIRNMDRLDSAELADAEARFRMATGLLQSGAIWRSGRDYPDRALQACAAGADLIVASAQRGPKTSTAAVCDVVLRAGIPVVAVPTNLPAIRTKNIVVAWKNTREARRAVSDALPLLIAAENVTVLCVCSPTEASADYTGLDDVISRLTRHGARAMAKRLERASPTVFDALTKFAEAQSADLIVAGAYGHSRLGEWILGGVTQDLLDGSSAPGSLQPLKPSRPGGPSNSRHEVMALAPIAPCRNPTTFSGFSARQKGAQTRLASDLRKLWVRR
jgi:nucleotide-binding universal stress UspA family protein